MDVSLFARGLLIGLSIAAVVGPMCILCIQRTVSRGQLYGLISGIGIATADAVYGSIAAFGLTVITGFLVSQQGWIRFLGAYVSTFLLTLTNPLTILSFAAIFAGIGVGGTSKSYLAALMVVLGVFAGSALWWCVLTGGVSLLRGKFTPQWLQWINRISGIIIVLFGAFALLSLINPH